MSLFEIKIYPFDLKLRNVFTISRSSRTSQTNVYISLKKDGFTGYGEAGPNSRYGETAESVSEYLDQVQYVINEVKIPDDIQPALEQAEKRSKIEPVYSARLALETAYLDWWGKSQDQTLSRLWGIKNKFTPVTSYTIGIDKVSVMQQKIREAEDYPLYKIKLGTGDDRAIIQAIRSVTNKPIRVDANEGWNDIEKAKREIDFLYRNNVDLVEQPMPASMNKKCEELKEWSPIPLCADESFTGRESLEQISASFDVVNIKLNKMGSVIRSMQKLREAREMGLEVMIGCMIESSMAISSGCLVALDADYADLDGHLLIRNDPFSGIDLTEEKGLKFSDKPGFGVSPNDSAPF